MTNSSYSGSLLGDTVSATVALNGVTANVPVTSYAGGQCAASVRFFFVSKAQSTVTSPSPGSLGQTEQLLLASNGSPSNPSFGLAPSAYYTQTWWSHSVSWALVSGASANLSELISTADWSDWNGQSAASLPAQFANAASHVQSFGLSFGGCGFYENGAGTSDGSGVFSMSNFSIG
ncbi:MAG: hypothetical protein KGJ39_01600 [Acidobacteriota bacterium]|nr:hypothetical protein [Acidobacteriota bacterium]